ncbi:hypothetical protein DFP72DRAFT_1092638 [Ephemerocybe angulata]|uniref:Uncharacterized protein n=1 Tax=Ephemerocybe angulata TaxID=980116 RepID=A0A8H6HDC4_9AGAR|nr:hypothetical protein DFP72DRAFT_1092638 [Tulosesus angulatus]
MLNLIMNWSSLTIYIELVGHYARRDAVELGSTKPALTERADELTSHSSKPGHSSTQRVHISLGAFTSIEFNDVTKKVEIGTGPKWEGVYEALEPYSRIYDSNLPKLKAIKARGDPPNVMEVGNARSFKI